MKRFIGMVAGLVLIVLGLGLIAAGTIGIVTFGTEGRYVSEPTRLQPSEGSLALVSDLAGVEVGIPFSEYIGSATIAVSPTGDEGLFMGVGPQADVDGYLFGAPYDLVSRGAGGEWAVTPVPGINPELAPPFDQVFWIDQSTGSRPVIDVTDEVDHQTLVIMSSEGLPAAAVDLTVGFGGPRIFPVAVAAAVVGLVLLLVGVPGLLTWGRRKGVAPAAASAASGSEDTVVVPAAGGAPGQAHAYPPSTDTDRVVDLSRGSATEGSLQGWFRDGEQSPGPGPE